jgi:hypothetical protein
LVKHPGESRGFLLHQSAIDSNIAHAMLCSFKPKRSIGMVEMTTLQRLEARIEIDHAGLFPKQNIICHASRWASWHDQTMRDAVQTLCERPMNMPNAAGRTSV